MSQYSFSEQLKKRRVIRAALIYVALVWAVLQAADLLAGANMITEQSVRWLILVAVIGFPVTVIASWFLDSPWRGKKWSALAGDLLIIVAISAAAVLFAWQQWFSSFTRPTVAVARIEATDTRDDTQLIADRFVRDLRTVLAMRPELRVLELSDARPETDFLLTGTLAQGDSTLRLTVQLFETDGQLVWGETFADNPADEAALLDRVRTQLYARLPLPATAIAAARELVASCQSLADRDSLVALARQTFSQLGQLAPPRRPVAQQMAMQHLADADALCPGWPDVGLLRLENTLELKHGDFVADKLLQRFPNSAYIYRQLAERRRDAGEIAAADTLFQEACLLQPTSTLPNCS